MPGQKTTNQNTPLVLIGGTAQSIGSWEHYLSSFSKKRDVLVYECLGQGPAPQLSSDVNGLEVNIYHSFESKHFSIVKISFMRIICMLSNHILPELL